MKILVTGGCGYIGSHAVVSLLNSGFEPVVFDNLSNSSSVSLDRVFDITGREVDFYKGDLTCLDDLDRVFSLHKFEAVIHFAGLKSVSESVSNPLKYYSNNVSGSINLIETMKKYGVTRFIFSSSATVYGEQSKFPIGEDAPLSKPENPYGMSKLMIENILNDLYAADQEWSVVILRYFNPVGAHSSGLIGEDPIGIPNNLMPFILETAIGKRNSLAIYGHDYPTHDGTGVRDYIHVVDLVEGHICALLRALQDSGIWVYNLGTGKGASVLDVVRAFETATGQVIACEFASRRTGDVAVSYADASRAFRDLGWTAERNLESMCADAWHWRSKNPQGYR
jgi:UDP-glucose 4-epimerase